MQIGYKLAAEGFGPKELIRQAVLAEQAGFDFVEMSDHYHPWLEAQGHSAFTWNLLSAIAMKTERIGLATGVTCPSVRYHPAIIAQAAATLAIISDGRFTLGAGAGRAAQRARSRLGFPARRVRHERFREALEIIRLLWRGGYRSYEGKYLQLEDARVFDLPDELPVIAVAASGPESAKIAADLGDGLFATEPDGDLVRTWQRLGGDGPAYAELPLAWAPDEDAAVAGGAGEEQLRADRLEGHGGAAQPGQLRGGHREHRPRAGPRAVRLRARRQPAPGGGPAVRRRGLRPPGHHERRAPTRTGSWTSSPGNSPNRSASSPRPHPQQGNSHNLPIGDTHPRTQDHSEVQQGSRGRADVHHPEQAEWSAHTGATPQGRRESSRSSTRPGSPPGGRC